MAAKGAKADAAAKGARKGNLQCKPKKGDEASTKAVSATGNTAKDVGDPDGRTKPVMRTAYEMMGGPASPGTPGDKPNADEPPARPVNTEGYFRMKPPPPGEDNSVTTGGGGNSMAHSLATNQDDSLTESWHGKACELPGRGGGGGDSTHAQGMFLNTYMVDKRTRYVTFSCCALIVLLLVGSIIGMIVYLSQSDSSGSNVRTARPPVPVTAPPNVPVPGHPPGFRKKKRLASEQQPPSRQAVGGET